MGVLLIAIGDSFYKELSYNMALSLKVSGCEEITLLTDDGGAYYSHIQRKAFSDFITVDEDYYTEDLRLNPFKLKTLINYYSPYKKTLYLDSDGLWLCGDFNKFFSSLSGFKIHEVGKYNKGNCFQSQMVWLRKKGDPTSNIEKAWEEYEIPEGNIYTESNSSFIYWEKSEEMDNFFSKVVNNYDDRRLPFTQIGKHYPDELAWSISMAQEGIKSEGSSLFRPIFFDYENKGMQIEDIKERFYFIGLAGGYIDRKLIRYYTNLVNALRINHGDGLKFSFNMVKKIYHER